MSRSWARSWWVVAGVVALVTAGTACGSRRDHGEFQATPGVRQETLESPAVASSPAGGVQTPAEGSTASEPSATGTELSGGPAGTVDWATRSPSGAPPRQASGNAPSAGDRSALPAQTNRGQAIPPGGGQPAPGQTGSTIRLGNVSDMSGPVGATFVGGVKVLQAWVQSVNTRGGVVDRDGIRHPVALTVVDARSSPSQHQAASKELVESKGVVAMLDNMDAVSIHGSTNYLTEKRIPAIGNLSGNDSVIFGNWIYFPVATSLEGYGFGNMQAAAKFAGGKKLGILYCQEAAGCGDIARKMAEYAPANGYEVAYQAAVSIAQPDFTAQCLAARNAGVEVLASAIDNNSSIRLASQCARQGFNPKYAPVTYDDRLNQYPEYNGSVFPNYCFPFAYHGPETAEFHEVFARNSGTKGVPHSISTVCAWSGAKLFEKAVSKISGEITSAALLTSLWSLSNETLGGLTPPFTYTKEKPATVRSCIYAMSMRDGKFVAPIGMAPICRPG